MSANNTNTLVQKIIDYIGYSDREDNIKYFTVTNDGKIFSDNAHTRLGYKGYYRTITCVTTDANEFNPNY